MKLSVVIIPRFIRLRDAPLYLGMDKNRFNAEVRPFVQPIPVGLQGIAFDRIDLDAWADDYKQRRGRPPTMRSKTTWDAKEHQGSIIEKLSGISTKRYTDADFVKALELVSSKKQKSTLPNI